MIRNDMANAEERLRDVKQKFRREWVRQEEGL